MTGQIHCRLLPDTKELSELGKLLKEKLRNYKDLYFIIQEQHRGQQAKQITVTSELIERMVWKRQFKSANIDVKLSDKIAITEMYLCFGAEGSFPISRFPRSLLQDENMRESECTSHCWINFAT